MNALINGVCLKTERKKKFMANISVQDYLTSGFHGGNNSD